MAIICEKEGCDSARESGSRYCLDHERERVKRATVRYRRRGKLFESAEGYLGELESKLGGIQMDVDAIRGSLEELRGLYGRK